MPINAKKIAKNTVFLYLRMLIILLCNLYLVRIAMEALGIDDYGINNIVGGVVSMLSFFTSTLASSSQRFFSYKIGENDFHGLSNYFSTSLWGFIIIALLILILGETVGLWFIQNKLNIPPSRLNAAIWIYHCSLISFILGLLAIPYSSLIIAYEKMKIFAYIGIIEAFLRLLSAHLLFLFSFDRLKIYAIFFCISTSVPSLYYIIYTTIKHEESRIKRIKDYTIVSEIFSFSGWTFLGAFSSIIRSQGINILLNIFFGPAVNAARGVAFQINSALNQFVLNFFKAVQPQIIKSYAAKDLQQTLTLIYKSSRICFFLVLVIAFPIFLDIPFILSFWLKETPHYTIQFSRLVIITAVIESTMYPLQAALMAAGNIKWYQIFTSFIMFLNLPIAYVLLKTGFSPESVFYLAIILAITAQFSRLFFVKKQLGLSLTQYGLSVIIPSLLVTIASSIPPLLIKFYFSTILQMSFISLIISCTTVALFSFTIGLNKQERISILSFIKKRAKF